MNEAIELHQDPGSSQLECSLALILAFFVPLSYIGLLYVFDKDGVDRNSWRSIRRRSLGVTVSTASSCLLTAALLTQQGVPVASAMGFRMTGLLPSAVLPLLLTMVLFLGPLTVMLLDGLLQDLFSIKCWTEVLSDPIGVRNLLTAPITEELAFRSCAIPLMLTCFEPNTVVQWAPALFSLCHCHHIFDRVRHGSTWLNAAASSAFQAAYTYVFGVYSSYLFIRTGHVLACIVSHMFCNWMGFPEVAQIFAFRRRAVRLALIVCYVLGLGAWYMLLEPCTEPQWYN